MNNSGKVFLIIAAVATTGLCTVGAALWIVQHFQSTANIAPIVSNTVPPMTVELPPPGLARDRLMSMRAAQMDCYRLLAERIFGFKLRSGTTVRDFVTESDRIQSALEAPIKGARLSKPLYFSDGSCEVDAVVTIEQVVTVLKQAAEQYGDGRWKPDEIEEIRRTERSDIHVTGSGAPRSNVPDPSDEHVVWVTAPPMPECLRKNPIGRLNAERVAELAAYRLLVERIYGLELSSGTHVRDFVTQDDRIHAISRQYIRGMRKLEPRYNSDCTVDVPMEMTIVNVVSDLKQLCKEQAPTGRWNDSSFDEIPQHYQRTVIRVVGTGALDNSTNNNEAFSQ